MTHGSFQKSKIADKLFLNKASLKYMLKGGKTVCVQNSNSCKF